ncbi:hypothetical protein [Paraburkholderia sp. MM6662-R1]|uniref:hypothetical protein n=1 Tax=Paraburkholderia sp. MM6662-R1 TaxID=2991066 RepID=UPI003D1B5F68
MTRVSKAILFFAVAIGLGTAIVPTATDYLECQIRGNRLRAEIDQVYAGKLKVEQMSEDAFAALDRELRTKVRQPDCGPGKDITNFGALGVSFFLIVFVGSHIGWLIGRAYKKAMQKLA